MSTEQLTALLLTSSIMFILASVGLALVYVTYEGHTERRPIKKWTAAVFAVVALFEAGSLAHCILTGGVG